MCLLDHCGQATAEEGSPEREEGNDTHRDKYRRRWEGAKTHCARIARGIGGGSKGREERCGAPEHSGRCAVLPRRASTPSPIALHPNAVRQRHAPAPPNPATVPTTLAPTLLVRLLRGWGLKVSQGVAPCLHMRRARGEVGGGWGEWEASGERREEVGRCGERWKEVGVDEASWGGEKGALQNPFPLCVHVHRRVRVHVHACAHSSAGWPRSRQESLRLFQVAVGYGV